MITLRPFNMRWLDVDNSDAAELCIHGEVEFRINGAVLIEPTDCEILTVSAAALFPAPKTTRQPRLTRARRR